MKLRYVNPTLSRRFLLFTFHFLLFSTLTAQDLIIPKPVKTEIVKGDPLLVDASLLIIADTGFRKEADLLAGMIKQYTGNEIGISSNVPSRKGAQRSGKAIVLQRSADNTRFAPEAYTVLVNGKSATITASSAAGIFYGGITVLQLITKDTANDKRFTIPAISVTDKPRFSWRGIMLDCSRTFMSADYLKRTIDRMAFYKLNTLHLHLTDDQGWRIEIKKRPLLTSKGAFFADNYHEPKEFQGYYTQQDIRDIVNYAAERHVRIVPEIEAPGHSSAAIHAYPELSCSGREVPIYPLRAGSPLPPNDVFCAGNEGTYAFFDDVLKEVAPLFPYEFIHLGGDEVSKHHWKNCPKCQGKKKAENLADEEKLQSYLMNRIGKTVTRTNRRPIGWDEVLEGGVDKNWLIMAWRGEEKGMEAAGKGYDVVMTPTTHLYFDYRYVVTPTKKVYSYEPVPDSAAADAVSRVLGIQANFWSHVERTESRIDHMLFPRALALAERAWSDRSVKDYDNFKKRKEGHRNWLRLFDIQFNQNDDPQQSPWDLVW